MKHQIVSSSFISTVGYDATTKTLEIRFASGKSATHENIDPEQHKALMNANSVGSYYNANIKSPSANTPAPPPIAKSNVIKR